MHRCPARGLVFKFRNDDDGKMQCEKRKKKKKKREREIIDVRNQSPLAVHALARGGDTVKKNTNFRTGRKKNFNRQTFANFGRALLGNRWAHNAQILHGSMSGLRVTAH